MSDIKTKRLQFLYELYKESEQDELKSCNAYKIGVALGFDETTTDKIIRYFINEGLIRKPPAKPNESRGTVAITHSGICHVETAREKRAQFFRELQKESRAKKGNSPYIKAGGNIVAGGDVIVGNKNINKQGIPTKKKEMWYQTNTFKFVIVPLIVALFLGLPSWFLFFRKNHNPIDNTKTFVKPEENQNLGQQTILSNEGDSNISVVQNQGINPNEIVDRFADAQKVLGKTEYELEKIKSENQELQSIVNTYKREDKEIRAALERAENIEKTKVMVRIFQEHDKGNIIKEEALKLSDMVNKTLWEDLKSFLENKNIQIDEHNQSLVVSGIFMAKVRDDGLRARYNPAKIDYVLTPEGDKLYEIAKTANLE